MSKLNIDGRVVIRDAEEPLEFKVSADHVVGAKCLDESKCVIAQAVLDSFKGVAKGISVGRRITKIQFPGYIVRYTTPKVLRDALMHFDWTGTWDIPEGTYSLLVPTVTEQLGRKRSKRRKTHQAKKATKSAAAASVLDAYIKPREVTRVPSRRSNRLAKQASKVKRRK